MNFARIGSAFNTFVSQFMNFPFYNFRYKCAANDSFLERITGRNNPNRALHLLIALTLSVNVRVFVKAGKSL